VAEQHADPENVQTREDLGRALTVLRSEAGLTVRELARRVDAPAATLGDYFAGRHLPGARQLPLYHAILHACGVRDAPAVERWVAALTRVRLTGDGRAAKGPAPYRGLDAFGEADADLFFGRRAEVGELLDRLGRIRERSSAAGGGAVAVVGPSGSGKTSLLMAGLLPEVRAGAQGDEATRWDIVVLTPDQLVPAAQGAPNGAPATPTLVVIDQLETALTFPAARRSDLMALVEQLQQRSLVVLGLRADFYQAALTEPTLLGALRDQVILGPMTADELREAVVGPLRHVGAGIEEGLVDLILADLTPGSPPGFAHEPGALPLLSYALLATWERATRNQLTISDYRAVGGLRGAVRQAAEALYEDLSGPEQEQARRLFTRLVRLDGDGPPTRRRASRSELVSGGSAADGRTAEAVLERFVGARLLTADAQTVQVSHEALLDAWPRLAAWVDADRDWLRTHHRITDAAQSWVESGRDEALLWRGGRLETALELTAAPEHERNLNHTEREFLSASSAHRHAQERARRRRTRRTQQLLAVVTALAVAASVLAVVAVDARTAAERARDQALSRQVAVESQQLQPTDPSLAAQLALAAYRISPTVQARSTLVDATAGEIPARLLGPVGPEFVAVAERGRLLAVAQSATDTVALYRLRPSGRTELAQVRVGPPSDSDFAVALSASGRLLAAGGTTDAVGLWDVADPARPRRLATLRGLSSTVYSLDFAPGDRRLAAADADGTVHQWSLTAGGRPAAGTVLRMPGDAAAKAVAYSPNGTWLAAAGLNGALAVWATGDPAPFVAAGTAGTDFESVTFDPRGTQLAVGSGNDHTLEIWDLSTGGRLQLAHGPFTVATSEVNSTAFSPDGSLLAVGAADGSLQLYDTRTWTPVATFGDPDPVTSLAFTPGGHHLASADSGGVTRIWPLPAPSTFTEPGNVYTLRYTTNGSDLIASSAGATGGVTVWSDANPLRPTRLADVAMPAAFGPAAGAAAISPDGHLLAVGNAEARIQLFAGADLAHLAPVGRPLHGDRPYIEQLGFSPDGRLLVAGDDSGQVRLWDVRDPARPRPLPTIRGTHGQILGFAFSPSGDILATASSDTKVRLYDLRRPDRARLLATVGGFASYAYDTTITPDGRTLIAGSADGTVRIWDISDPSHPRLLGPPLTGPTGYVFQLAVSPDGRTLAAATTAHAVWLWNIADPAHPRLTGTLGAAKDEVFAVGFDPKGPVLAASGSDDTLHFWDYQPAAAARQVCAQVGSAITRAEWARYVQGAPYRPPCP